MKPAENCSILPLAQGMLMPGWKALSHLCAGPLLLLQEEGFLLCSPSSLGQEEQETWKRWRKKEEKVERMEGQKEGRKKGRERGPGIPSHLLCK